MFPRPTPPPRAPDGPTELPNATLGDEGSHSLQPLTRIAAQVLHAPISILTLMNDEHEVIEGSVGLPDLWVARREVAPGESFCRHVITGGRPLLVEDTRKHALTRTNPAIGELHAVAYAGVPVRRSRGEVIGALCVIDHLPRRWFTEEVEILSGLASVVESEIEQRFALHGAWLAREESERVFAERLEAVSLFRTLVEHSLAGIYVVRDGRIEYANPRTLQIFGYSADEPTPSLHVDDLVVEEDRACVDEQIRKRLAGETDTLHYGFRGRRRDGSTVEVEVMGSLIELGGHPAVVGTVLDLTERRAVEAALQENAQRLRLVERATEDVIWEWDVHSGCVRWNEAGPKMFRYAPGEVGDTIEWHQDRIHPDDRERVVRRLQQTLSGAGEFWSDEYRFLRGDGQYATVLDRGCVVRNERGEPANVLGIMMDVTERKREEDAQRFLSRASAILDSSMEYESVLARLARMSVPLIGDYCLIDLVDENGALHRVATAHADPIKEILLAETNDGPSHAAVRQVMRTGNAVLVLDCDDPHLEGLGYGEAAREALRRMGICSLIIAPLMTGEQRLGGITVGISESNRAFNPLDLMLVRDLASRIGLAVDHARLYQRATEAVRARDEILGVVSHDLRNPLSAIQMTATLLRDGTQDRRADTQKWLDLIQRTVVQMKVLIDDLLDVSRIEAGHFSVEAVDRNPAALVREAADLLQPLTIDKEIHFTADAPDDLPLVRIDSHQMLRVISNLLGNAVKFTPPKGSVSLRAERSGDDVLFSVTDSGPGIPRDQIPHVFDRFWQARPGDRRGAGLGLSIARGIVEAHGGRIWVESSPGQGTTVSFSLPVDREAGTDTGDAPPGATDQRSA